jgi:hypothetical protein
MFYHVWSVPNLYGNREYLGVQWIHDNEVAGLRARGMVIDEEPIEQIEITAPAPTDSRSL